MATVTQVLPGLTGPSGLRQASSLRPHRTRIKAASASATPMKCRSVGGYGESPVTILDRLRDDNGVLQRRLVDALVLSLIMTSSRLLVLTTSLLLTFNDCCYFLLLD